MNEALRIIVVDCQSMEYESLTAMVMESEMKMVVLLPVEDPFEQ